MASATATTQPKATAPARASPPSHSTKRTDQRSQLGRPLGVDVGRAEESLGEEGAGMGMQKQKRSIIKIGRPLL